MLRHIITALGRLRTRRDYFGLWRGKDIDALRFERALRNEWRH